MEKMGNYRLVCDYSPTYMVSQMKTCGYILQLTVDS